MGGFDEGAFAFARRSTLSEQSTPDRRGTFGP